MPNWFRKSQLDPLAVSMSGVKLGDRLLVIGCSDPALIAALATKAGLTGRACAVDDRPELVADAARAVERAGALIESQAVDGGTLPYEAESFDVVVLRDVLPAAAPNERTHRVAEVLRVLRPGGRCLVIDGGTRTGFLSRFAPREANDQYTEAGGAKAALAARGFAAVRTLAEREGMVFVEGVKKNEPATGHT